MMHEVEIRVTVQVDSDNENVSLIHAQDTAREAVENAVKAGEANGFEHAHAETMSIGVVDVEVLDQPWDDDTIQFARLLCEMMATQDSLLDLKEVAESMDLTVDRVNELLDRAHTAWEKAKAAPGSWEAGDDGRNSDPDHFLNRDLRKKP